MPDRTSYYISELQLAALNSPDHFLEIAKQAKQPNQALTVLNNTPLFAAVTNNQIKVLEWYIKYHQSSLRQKNLLGYTPLFWAIDAGIDRNLTVINSMMAAMDNLGDMDNLGNNIMHLLVDCLSYQDPELVISLMRKIHTRNPSLLQQPNLAAITPLEQAKKLDLNPHVLTECITAKLGIR